MKPTRRDSPDLGSFKVAPIFIQCGTNISHHILRKAI
jgi:hypothetical protein